MHLSRYFPFLTLFKSSCRLRFNCSLQPKEIPSALPVVQLCWNKFSPLQFIFIFYAYGYFSWIQDPGFTGFFFPFVAFSMLSTPIVYWLALFPGRIQQSFLSLFLRRCYCLFSFSFWLLLGCFLSSLIFNSLTMICDFLCICPLGVYWAA